MLEQLGLKFEIRESGYREDMEALKDPFRLVRYLAFKKTEEVARRYADAIVIGADTFIVFKNKFLGKPKSRAEARAMLKSLSGKEHSVVTGFCVLDTRTGKMINSYDESRVRFRKLSEEEIDAYVKTGLPLDRAGAYGIQDRSAVFIKSIEGDYHSILGLPLAKIYLALKKVGVSL